MEARAEVLEVAAIALLLRRFLLVILPSLLLLWLFLVLVGSGGEDRVEEEAVLMDPHAMAMDPSSTFMDPLHTPSSTAVPWIRCHSPRSDQVWPRRPSPVVSPPRGSSRGCGGSEESQGERGLALLLLERQDESAEDTVGRRWRAESRNGGGRRSAAAISERGGHCRHLRETTRGRNSRRGETCVFHPWKRCRLGRNYLWRRLPNAPLNWPGEDCPMGFPPRE